MTSFLIGLALLAQAPEIRDLSPMLAERVAADGMPALTAWITDGERTLARGVAGVRVRGGETKATLDDRWHIGSCTKSMTATLFATLVMQGVDLSERTTPLELFPEFAETADPAWKEVTMRRLLTNRAGVVGNLGGKHPALWGRCYSGQMDGPTQRRLLVQVLTGQPPELAPGSAYLYSNAGFSIAGAMLEAKVGVPFEELMRDHLFGPLGMESAGFGPPGVSNDAAAPDAPWGHDALEQPMAPGIRRSDNPEVITPAGRVHLTMEDWARYARFHLRGEAKDHALLPSIAVKRLHEPEVADAKPRYAAGWIVGEIGDPPTRLLAHSGSNTMWYAVIWLAPEKDLAVLIACNDGTKSSAMEKLAVDLYSDAVAGRALR
ncbi:MAG: serine hydrolase [Planctomycetota bacterium]|nr:serine hydrolase [Planctomycetota bacterium]